MEDDKGGTKRIPKNWRKFWRRILQTKKQTKIIIVAFFFVLYLSAFIANLLPKQESIELFLFKKCPLVQLNIYHNYLYQF